jgi:hypothetical protein
MPRTAEPRPSGTLVGSLPFQTRDMAFVTTPNGSFFEVHGEVCLSGLREPVLNEIVVSGWFGGHPFPPPTVTGLECQWSA